MPNRILREGVCTSETINSLPLEQEVFFYRLLVVADDFGLMDARLPILKARCFPLRAVKESQIQAWLLGLRAVGLVSLYESDGKPYASVCKWDQHQRIRNARPKYPRPTESNLLPVVSNPLSIDSNPPPESESESNPNLKPRRATPLPEGFGISERVKTWADGKGLTALEEDLEFFVGRMRASGKKYIDWDEAFMNCVREDWAGLRKEKR